MESTEGNDVPDDQLDVIRDAYMETVVVPDSQLKEPFVLCPIGLVGSGKTTVVKPLAERLKLFRISTDDIRMLLKSRGYNFVRTGEIAFGLVQRLVKEGKSVVVDADCISGINIVEKLPDAPPIFWIHINPPEKWIVKKLENFHYLPGQGFENAEEALEVFHVRKKIHEESRLSVSFTYTFDTSTNLDEQLDEAETAIRTQLGIDKA